MDTKKKNTKRGNGTKSHDIAGIICILVSAFFLICLVTPLLSDIGTFVKRLTTGIFGYMSYVMSVCALIIGIMLLMNKKPALSAKQIAFLVLIAVFAVMILQTALDHSRMNGGFSEYLSTVISFDPENATAGKSVGGAFFGMLAYGMKSILSFVGAYILYSLLLVLFCVLFVMDFNRGRKVAPKKARSGKQQIPFEKGTGAQTVKDYNDTSLFVGEIIPNPNRVSTRSGDFSSIPSPVYDNLPRYDSAENEEEKQKESAKKILFNNPEEMFKAYENEIKGSMNIGENVSGRSNYFIDERNAFSQNNRTTPSYQTPPYQTPSYHAPSYQTPSYQTPKYKTPQFEPYHKLSNEPKVQKPTYEKARPVLPDVPIPPEKDVSDQFIDGPILNGDELSKTIQDDKRLRRNVDKGRNEFEMPPVIMSEPKVKAPEPTKDEESPLYFDNDDGLPPIIMGNPKVKAAKPTKDEESPLYFDNDDGLPPIIMGNPKVKAPEPAKDEESSMYFDNDDGLPPIIMGNPEVKSPEPIKDEKDEEPLQDDLSPVNTDNEAIKSTYNEAVSNTEEKFEEEGKEEKLEAEATDNAAGENSPIVNGDYMAEIEIDENLSVPESEIEAETSARQGEVEAETSARQGEIQEPQSESSEEPKSEEKSENGNIAAKIPDSMKLIEEEVDMSETRDEVDDDNTGYYTTEGFNQKVHDLALKLGNDQGGGITNVSKGNNQIKMDDLRPDVPEKSHKPKKHLRYTPPPIDLLINSSTQIGENEDYEEKINALEGMLHDLKVNAKVINVTRGPAVTRYELEMPVGMPVKRITNYAEDIAYSLASSGKVRIEAPIRGKRAVGVEVPNQDIAIVSLREIIDSKDFNEAKSMLTLALGKDIIGNIVTCNLEKMPHLLIAGTTGSGKSACLNSIIISILYKSSPDDVRLILIDPKQVEFGLYRDMPHLLMKNIINDSSQAINAFKWARDEMDRRYTLFAKYAVRNLGDFNDSPAVKSGAEPKLPRIVIVVDELADLMLQRNARELEQNIMSMAQKARAAGMHLILATQRPSVDVLTGTIKANLPSRIAFAVKSITDSRTILDQIGAETLLGRGDMLYAPIDTNEPKRVQGAFITTEEIENIVNFVRENNETDYDEAAENIIMRSPDENLAAGEDEKTSDAGEDPLMKEVLKRVIETKQASASMIQRKFSVGYNKASRIIDQMEEKGYIGPLDGAKPREVYITREMFMNIYGEDI